MYVRKRFREGVGPMRILFVDDDRELSKNVCQALRDAEFDIYPCYDGLSAVEYVSNNTCDLVIMDVNMPKLDGISALKEINKIRNIPVILTSERDSEIDVLYAYEAGCVDYIRKPYYIKEIVMKLKNCYNRSQTAILKFSGLEIDTLGRKIYVDGEPKDLTQKEFQLLFYLVKNLGIAVPREKLLNDVWGYGFFGDDRTIDTHIKMLRSTLGPYKDYIQTIRGFGYKFEVK